MTFIKAVCWFFIVYGAIATLYLLGMWAGILGGEQSREQPGTEMTGKNYLVAFSIMFGLMGGSYCIIMLLNWMD